MVRALRAWSEDDQVLPKANSRGEFSVNGLCNRDLLALLFPEAAALPTAATTSVARTLRMIRAHRITRKLTGTPPICADQRRSPDGDGNSPLSTGLSGTIGEGLRIFAKNENSRVS
jgi:hypothetical protein